METTPSNAPPLIPVILAGGSGTRLWPLSRELYPKQLMPLIGQQTMIQDTLSRLVGLPNIHDPIVICNENHRFMVAEQLRQLGLDAASILLEPVGRNTAPAVAAAALYALKSFDDACLLVLPADHYIEDSDALSLAVNAGVLCATDGRLVTFGILPTAPETGYGYIRQGGIIRGPGTAEGIRSIDAFVEKPDRATAEGYLASGDFYWNSGMFLFLAKTVLGELRRLAPEMLAVCESAVDSGRSDLDFFRLDEVAFNTCPSDSIDYAVMEKTDLGAMVPLDAGWSDLGSWEALWQVGAKDEQRNVVSGETLLYDVNRSFIRADSRLVAAVGVTEHIIVETADAVFISPRDRVQDIKHLVSRLKSSRRIEAVSHPKVYRPWGVYETVFASTRFEVKRLFINPGSRISKQMHHHRAEHWIVVNGIALVSRGDEQFLLREDESTYIPSGVPHRLENTGKIPVEIIEVRTGGYLREDDITRFDDDYGR